MEEIQNVNTGEVIEPVKEKKEINRPSYKALYEELQKENELLKSLKSISDDKDELTQKEMFIEYKNDIESLIDDMIIMETKLQLNEVRNRVITLSQLNNNKATLVLALRDFKETYGFDYNSVSLNILNNFYTKVDE
jgi:hypothetical protein